MLFYIYIKSRLLRRYRTLKVPVGKLSNLKNVPSLKVAEKQNLSFNEEAMALLQVRETWGQRGYGIGIKKV